MKRLCSLVFLIYAVCFASRILIAQTLTISKTFERAAMPGETINLEFTITNNDRNFPATDISFRDNLDYCLSGLRPEYPAPIYPCGLGSELTFFNGEIELSGGTLGPYSICSFLVEVVIPGSAPDGKYWNSTNLITATIGGAFSVGNSAFDQLEVDSNLPVELTSFTAEFDAENNILLQWETATEINNYGFAIERRETGNSTQNTGWEDIGFVHGHGNSNSPKYYEFIDVKPFGEDADAGILEYRLKQIDTDGTFKYYGLHAEVNTNGITSLEADPLTDGLLTEFALEQNYPNPFNPETNIKFDIPKESNVKLEIFNIAGQKIRTIINTKLSPGTYHYSWTGRKDNGKLVSAGLYIYRLVANNYISSKKLLLLK